MGRGQKRKQASRLRETEAFYSAGLLVKNADSRLEQTPSESLFFVDTLGKGASTRRATKKAKKGKKTSLASGAKLAKRKSARDLRGRSEAAVALRCVSASMADVRRQQSGTHHRRPETRRGEYDLWGVGPEKVRGPRREQPARIRHEARTVTSAPDPGLSYNPSTEAHQDALAVATARCIEDDEAAEERRKPLSRGLEGPAKALEAESSDEEEEDEEEGDSMDDDNEPNSLTRLSRRSLRPGEKASRALRNKQRRLAERSAKEAKHSSSKNLLKSIHQAKAIVKDLEEERAASEAKCAQLAEWNAAKLAAPKVPQFHPRQERGRAEADPTADVVNCVLLSDEVSHNLRSTRLKSSLVGVAADVSRRNRASKHSFKRNRKFRDTAGGRCTNVKHHER